MQYALKSFDNLGQHFWLLLPMIFCTWKSVVTAKDQYTNSTFYFSQRETEITVATSLSIMFILFRIRSKLIPNSTSNTFNGVKSFSVINAAEFFFLLPVHNFHNIPYLSNNLRASILCVPQNLVILTLRSLLLLFFS